MTKTTPQTDRGFIRIATGTNDNDILTALIKASLNATEYQVVLTVFRKTWGWNKKEDWISYTQFEKLTGKTRPSIWNAIEQLVKKNILVRDSKQGKQTFYRVNKDFSTWQLVKSAKLVKQTKLVKKTLPTSKENLTQLVKKTKHTKETITKETIQKKYSSLKKIQKEDIEQIANKYSVPVSFVQSKLDDLKNYCEAKGKRYKNYKSALRNFVKKDAIERLDNAKKANSKRGVDLSYL